MALTKHLVNLRWHHGKLFVDSYCTVPPELLLLPDRTAEEADLDWEAVRVMFGPERYEAMAKPATQMAERLCLRARFNPDIEGPFILIASEDIPADDLERLTIKWYRAASPQERRRSILR